MTTTMEYDGVELDLAIKEHGAKPNMMRVTGPYEGMVPAGVGVRRTEIGPDMTGSGEKMAEWLALDDEERKKTFIDLLADIADAACDDLDDDPNDIDHIVWLRLVMHLYRISMRDYGRDTTMGLFTMTIAGVCRSVIRAVMGAHELNDSPYWEFAHDALLDLRNFDVPIVDCDADLREKVSRAIRSIAKDSREIAPIAEELAFALAAPRNFGAEVVTITQFVIGFSHCETSILLEMDDPDANVDQLSCELNIWCNMYFCVYMLGHLGQRTIPIPARKDSICELFTH